MRFQTVTSGPEGRCTSPRDTAGTRCGPTQETTCAEREIRQATPVGDERSSIKHESRRMQRRRWNHAAGSCTSSQPPMPLPIPWSALRETVHEGRKTFRKTKRVRFERDRDESDDADAPEPAQKRPRGATGDVSLARPAINRIYGRVQWMSGHVIHTLKMVLKRYHATMVGRREQRSASKTTDRH